MSSEGHDKYLYRDFGVVTLLIRKIVLEFRLSARFEADCLLGGFLYWPQHFSRRISSPSDLRVLTQVLVHRAAGFSSHSEHHIFSPIHELGYL